MRIKIRHETRFAFDPSGKSIIQTLRMTPRNHEGQRIVSWRMDVNIDCILRPAEDSFGNVLHTFSAEGPVSGFTITAEGEVETFDMSGIVRGGIERFPNDIYLRETDQTIADKGLRAFALKAAEGNEGTLDTLHRLMTAVHEGIAIDPDASATDIVPAADILAARTGSAANVGQVFAAASRYLGIPTRIIEGYYLAGPFTIAGGHSWAEAFVEGLGWIGFDAAHDLCPQENHVRAAVGLDRLGTAPVRVAPFGGLAKVQISLNPRLTQSQSQSQS